jgi:hypothetical protein
VTDYSFSGGPRINVKPFFIHAVFGGDHLTGSAQGYSASQDSMAGLAGGDMQWKVSGPWSVRASVDYAFTRHNIFGGPSVTQNNDRASAGIVYSFGARRANERTTGAPAPAAASEKGWSTVRAEMKISSLGVLVTLGRRPGAESTEEAPGGLADLAGNSLR